MWNNSNLQEAINESLEIKAAVILLVHTRDDVDKALKQQDRFFVDILNGQHLIYHRKIYLMILMCRGMTKRKR